MKTPSGHEYGSEEWHDAIVAAYADPRLTLVVDIGAKFGCSPATVSYLARRAVARKELRRMRGKGFIR